MVNLLYFTEMDLDIFYDQWETLDLVKATCALAAGLILGFERELKDKAAGLRTITLICLGCTLFTILSYKMGMGKTEDATRIASYVVSGIGFLGAGVIFKDAFSINGLTTASIIWLAAAIGMSIGFGQFFLALTFLLCSLFIIHFGGFINKKFLSNILLRNLEIVLEHIEFEEKVRIEETLQHFCKRAELKRIEDNGEEIKLYYECKVRIQKITEFQDYLVGNEKILKFSV